MPRKDHDKTTHENDAESAAAGPPIKEELFPGAVHEEITTAQASAIIPSAPEFFDKEYTKDESGARKIHPIGQENRLTIKADVAERIAELRAEFIFELGRVRDQLQSQLTANAGMEAEMVGGIFNCPKCGLRLNSPSTTGMKGQLYEHPFDTSPKLSGVQCELKGKKFLPPGVFLRMAPDKSNKPKPLTEETK